MARIATWLCYFLPFIFFFQKCTGAKYYAAYNYDEYLHIKDNVPTTQWGRNVDSLRALEVKSFSQKLFSKALKPTNYSASGFGAVMYAKDKWANFFIICSIILTQLLCLTAILRKHKIDTSLLSLNTFIVIAFILVNYYTKVTLQYGVFVLLAALLIQLFFEIMNTRKYET